MSTQAIPTTHRLTFGVALGRHDVPIPSDLVADAEVPVLTGPQRQGDVGIWPRPPIGAAELATAVKVPREGVAVVRGESATGGNSHILDAHDGDVFWVPVEQRAGDVTLGVLHVPEGSVAALTHTDEHGCNAIGPGTFRLTGKREMADEIRRVAD